MPVDFLQYSSMMTIDPNFPLKTYKISAFTLDDQGGNPAGVVVCASFPTNQCMQDMAREIGYSETAFACPLADGWRVRYFSPEQEVPFCGHATIALGAALAMSQSAGRFILQLNTGRISVDAVQHEDLFEVSLVSPRTSSKPAPASLTGNVLDMFGYSRADLDTRIPPALIYAGSDHLVIALNDIEALHRMRYDMEVGRELMQRESLVTIALVYCESQTRFLARNAFAYGGVYEDPATGAAAAAFSGYLRDLGWHHTGGLEILQGIEMGMPSRIIAEIPDEIGGPIKISGTARMLVTC